MRTIMMGLVLATMMGCATVGGGWDTGKLKMGTDCKPHPISNAIPGLPKGAVMPSPSTVIMDPKDKPKDGVVVIPTDGCGGSAVRVIRLVEDGERVKDPAGNMGPQKYRADDVPAADWNK
jgi:hypothetical protein